MSAFFADRPAGRTGLALFLNAGDPPLDVFRELVLMLDACKIDCLELAVPFPNSPSDGPVIRESAARALYPDQEAVGATFRSGKGRQFTIIGVVRDVQRSLGGRMPPPAYVFPPRDTARGMTIVARMRNGADSQRGRIGDRKVALAEGFT